MEDVFGENGIDPFEEKPNALQGTDGTSLVPSEVGLEIYEDCAQVLSNVCDTKAEIREHLKHLVDLMAYGTSEEEIYKWLKIEAGRNYNDSRD